MAKRVLLADDSVTIQKVVQFMLAEEDLDIRFANNGDEALSALSSFRPDIVLADVEMPGMNGYELCKEIRLNPETMNIPVILLTGAFEQIDDKLADSVEADDYIVKPFESEELIDKINSLILKQEALRIDEVASEDIEVSRSRDKLMMLEEVLPAPAALEAFAITPEEADIADNPGVTEAVEAEEEPGGIVSEEIFITNTRKDVVLSERVDILSKDELADIFRKAINDGIVVPLMSEISEIKDTFQSTLASSIKGSVESVVRRIVPDLAEKLIGEMITSLSASLTKEAEKAVWKTVPGLAEAIITKEIERIKAEL